MAPVLAVHLVGHNGFTDLFDAPKLDWIFSKINCLLSDLVIREALNTYSKPGGILKNMVIFDRLLRVVLGQPYRGLTGRVLFLRIFSGAISVSPLVCFILD